MDSIETVQQTSFHYLAYGASLHPKLLAQDLGRIKPISSSAVTVPSAYLSFDHINLAFLEPCHTSAIITGFNDKDWNQSSPRVQIEKARNEEEEGRGVGVDSTAYSEWVWARCCPGMEFTGVLPPSLEGVAYEISSKDWPIFSAQMEQLGHFIPVDCIKFEGGDHLIPTGALKAYISIVSSSKRLPNLQPTTSYLRLVLIGAFYSTHILSQPFIGHLVLLRPYEPTTLLKKLGKKIFSVALLPSFFLQSILGLNSRSRNFIGRFLGRVIGVLVWRGNSVGESILRPVFGSGYRND